MSRTTPRSPVTPPPPSHLFGVEYANCVRINHKCHCIAHQTFNKPTRAYCGICIFQAAASVLVSTLQRDLWAPPVQRRTLKLSEQLAAGTQCPTPLLSASPRWDCGLIAGCPTVLLLDCPVLHSTCCPPQPSRTLPPSEASGSAPVQEWHAGCCWRTPPPRGGGRVVWGPGQPRPTKSPTHIRKNFPQPTKSEAEFRYTNFFGGL